MTANLPEVPAVTIRSAPDRGNRVVQAGRNRRDSMVSAVDDDAWFEDDGDLGEADRAFAAPLRLRATNWPTDPASTRINSPRLGHPLIAWLDVDTPGRNLSLMTVGVHLQGSELRGDKLHN